MNGPFHKKIRRSWGDIEGLVMYLWAIIVGQFTEPVILCCVDGDGRERCEISLALDVIRSWHEGKR